MVVTHGQEVQWIQMAKSVDPMENNMMSYFSPCADYVFTDDQKEAIQNDYDSPQRNYIKNNYTPNLDSRLQKYLNCMNQLTVNVTAGYNVVNFDWEEVPGAQYYMLEIDQVQPI